MICTFFGHKDSPNDLKSDLERAVLYMIDSYNVTKFYVGNNGNFDFLVQQVLKKVITVRTQTEYYVVLSSLSEKAIGGAQSNTIFPEGLDYSPPRFAICKRNEWMIKNSDFAIVYVRHKFSNSYKWAAKCLKRGIKLCILRDSPISKPLG